MDTVSITLELVTITVVLTNIFNLLRQLIGTIATSLISRKILKIVNSWSIESIYNFEVWRMSWF